MFFKCVTGPLVSCLNIGDVYNNNVALFVVKKISEINKATTSSCLIAKTAVNH